jgi:hypothetical protein
MFENNEKKIFPSIHKIFYVTKIFIYNGLRGYTIVYNTNPT